MGSNTFTLECRYLGFDGKVFEETRTELAILRFRGGKENKPSSSMGLTDEFSRMVALLPLRDEEYQASRYTK